MLRSVLLLLLFGGAVSQADTVSGPIVAGKDEAGQTLAAGHEELDARPGHASVGAVRRTVGAVRRPVGVGAAV